MGDDSNSRSIQAGDCLWRETSGGACAVPGSATHLLAGAPAPANAAVASAHRFSYVVPRHQEGVDWPWLSKIGSMRRHQFNAIYIENTYAPLPKATKPYIRWQYVQAMRAIRVCELAFIFSAEIAIGMTAFPSRLVRQPKRIYVGFTQEHGWSDRKVKLLSNALRQFDAITVFSEDERQLYIRTYGLKPQRVHLIPIHTDETQGYRQYRDARPIATPYVLSLGLPNRRFMPIARACKELHIPLVIITRSSHQSESLDELARMGATIIINASKHQSLTYIQHARLLTMAFQTPALPGAFTTLIHAMYLRTPSVVSTCLGMSDYLVHGENGLITPHGDDDALKQAIERLWHDDELNERFAAHGFERAQRLFSLDAAAQQFSDLAEHVLVQRD